MMPIDVTSLIQKRLDGYLAQILPTLSRTRIVSHARNVRVNGVPTKFSRVVHPGDRVQAFIDIHLRNSTEAEPVEFPVLYEDDYIVVINKPAGLVVHPGRGHHHGTLSQGLLYKYSSLQGWPHESGFRPGIVHRLDKETSGVMVAAKDIDNAYVLQQQFQRRTVEKEYIALVAGRCARTHGTIQAPIVRDPLDRTRFAVSADGKKAYTFFRVVRVFSDCSFLRMQPFTGRTHQLRVHARYCGMPILGDTVYAPKKYSAPFARLFLHAYRLTIRHPVSGASMRFKSPIPIEFWKLLATLKKEAQG